MTKSLISVIPDVPNPRTASEKVTNKTIVKRLGSAFVPNFKPIYETSTNTVEIASKNMLLFFMGAPDS